jgi:hypothetical protein
MKACRPAYVTPTAVNPDATILIFRRVRRSARKSFHVNCFCDPDTVELAVACWAAAEAPGAEDPHLTTFFVNVTGSFAENGRSVRCALVGRVEVENGAVFAEQDAIATG